ncbi:sulfatase [Polaromonas sp.]|uniref:sulfatase family protein n=1 Tax=Polaromonas sp. TaxID=1869339 RepID=UPI003BAA89AD
MEKRPNFLLFVTDQHRADHLGVYGNKIVQTPNIDSMAANGWRADRFYVATPLCMPNRASLATGRFPSAHGVRLNGVPLDMKSMTFMHALRNSGYRTALIGKAHLQNITEIPAAWPKGSERLTPEATQRLTGRYDQELGPTWRRHAKHQMDLPYYGFDSAALVINHGDDVDGDYRRWLAQAHPELARQIGAEHAIPTPAYELSAIEQAWRTRIPEDLYPTAWIADQTINALEAYQEMDAPFFVQCSFPDPHHPFTPPGRFWDMYRPEDVELPPSFFSKEIPPPHVSWLHAQRAAGSGAKRGHAVFAATEREAREAIALNYGGISNIDFQIGRVLEKLNELGQHQDTVVIFTTDHGDFMGDHQLLLKGPLHYQSLVRCPFIWSDPAIDKACVSEALTQSIDLAPSILERAGVAAYNGIQGRSLLPIMRGAVNTVRDSLMIEEEGQRNYLSFDSRVRARSVVTKTHRMSVYDGADWGELYDLEADPHEERNLWNKPEFLPLRNELTDRLLRLMLDASDQSPYPTSLA